MDRELEILKKTIEGKGVKFTKQKQLVLKVLIDSEIHLSAEEIHSRLKGQSVSMATVYRSLKAFNDAGIVKEIYAGGTGYYELKMFSGNPFHIHFQCNKCGKIIDIDSRKIDFEYLKLNSRIEKDNNLEIYDSNIMFKGLCSDCKKDRGDN